MTQKQKKIWTIAGLAAFLAALAALAWLLGRPLISFVADPERFRAWVDARGVWGKLIFVGMVALQVVVAFIPGEPLEIAAGYAFGALEGTLLCMAGITAGSAAVFWFVRRFGMKAVKVFFPQEKIEAMKFLQNSRRLTLLTAILFFIPGTPKDLMSYCVGLTPMKFSTWLCIAAFARIPSIVTSTLGGNALGVGDTTFAAIVFGATLLISLIGILIYRHICKKENKTDPPAS